MYLDGNLVATFDDPTDSYYTDVGEGSYTLLSTFHYNDPRRETGAEDGPYEIAVGEWEWDRVCYVRFDGIVPPLFTDNGRPLPLPPVVPVLEPETGTTGILTIDAIAGSEIYINERLIARLTEDTVQDIEEDLGLPVLISIPLLNRSSNKSLYSQ